MALSSQDVIIAVCVAGGAEKGVQVANTNAKFAPATFPVDPSARVDFESGVTWSQYVQCGYKGAFDVRLHQLIGRSFKRFE